MILIISHPYAISCVSLTVNIPRNYLLLTQSIRKLINTHGFREQLYDEGPQVCLSGPDVPFKLQLFTRLFSLEPSMVSESK